jgi:replicative DNA helicase
MYSRGGVIDLATVGMALRDAGKLEAAGGLVYIAELAEAVVMGAQAAWYADIVHDRAQRRKIIDACLAASAECYSPASDVQALREKLRAVADGEDTLASCTVSIADVAERVYENMANGTALKPMPLPWGNVNAVLKGGIVPGELAVLAARPGMGKTAFAGCVGIEAARRGIPVLFVSREVRDEALAARWMAREARIDYRFFRQGMEHAENILPRVKGIASALADLPLHILERSSRPVTPAEIRRVARKVRAGLVIVDYLQLITPDMRDKSREREVAEMSRAFKQMALDLSIPVFLLAQLNRQVEAGGKEPRKPRLSDLRESGAIEQDADIVMFLHSSGREQAMTTAPVSVVVAKGRSSGTGEARLKFEKPFQNFSEDMRGAEAETYWQEDRDNGL